MDTIMDQDIGMIGGMTTIIHIHIMVHLDVEDVKSQSLRNIGYQVIT